MADVNKITYVSLDKLGYYDGKIKEYIQTKDEALQTGLQTNINGVNTALENEVTRAKAAELANAAAAQAAQDDVDALAAKVGTVPENETVMSIINNIQENAYNDTELRGLISGLDESKADKTQVATDIADAVKVEEDARKEAVAGVQGAVDTLSSTHATDKAALEAAIALKADNTALEALGEDVEELTGTVASNKSDIEGKLSTLESKVDDNESDIEGKMTALTERVAANETAVKTTLPGAINDEKSAREAADAELAADIKAISDDYLTSEDKEELEGKITANTNAINKLNGEGEGSVKKAIDDAFNDFATKVTDDAVVNSYKELIDWAAEHGGEAAEMVEAIEANETAIGEINTFIGSLPEGATVTTVIAYVEKLVSDEAARAEGAESALSERLDAVEEMLSDGEGSVADQITEAADAAKEAAIEAAAADATEKADAAEAAAKEYADGLNTTMDGRVAALEGINHEAYIAADTALKTELEGKIDLKADKTALDQEIQDRKDADDALKTEVKEYVEEYADGLNTEMDGRVSALETASATHALASDLTALDGRVVVVEGKVSTLEGEMDAAEAAIATKAAQADHEALAGRVTTAEGEIDTLQSEMDAVEALAAANKAAHEANAAAIALKASQAALTEEINRAKGVEESLQAQINAFEECTTNDIDGLFA